MVLQKVLCAEKVFHVVNYAIELRVAELPTRRLTRKWGNVTSVDDAELLWMRGAGEEVVELGYE